MQPNRRPRLNEHVNTTRLTLLLVDEQGGRDGQGLGTVGAEGGGGVSSVASLPCHDRLLLGRDAACDLRFDDGRVSRRHCEIFRVGKLAWVRDLGSANGTYVDGEPVEVAPLPERATVGLGLGGPRVEIEIPRRDAPQPRQLGGLIACGAGFRL